MTRPPPLAPGSAVFLDVDGTLLEIAPRPELVRVPPELPGLLGRLERQREGALALISGRPLADFDRLFQPWRGAAAGLHGAERRRADGSLVGSSEDLADRDAAAALDRLRPALAECERRWPGAWLEDKGRTLALHYRAIPGKKPEIRNVIEPLAQQENGPLRLIAGKMVFEFQPRHHNKGAVIAGFLAEPPFRGRQPVFVGDDTTDEDGFVTVNSRGGVSIRVGPTAGLTAALYNLPSVAEALNWLSAAAAG